MARRFGLVNGKVHVTARTLLTGVRLRSTMPPMGADEQTSKIVRIPIELYRVASGIAASRSEDTGVEVTPMAVVRAALANGLEQLEKGAE